MSKVCFFKFFTKLAVTKWAKFEFSRFWSFKPFKILHFCQQMCLGSFSPSGRLTKWPKFVFQLFQTFRDFKLKSSAVVKRWFWVMFQQTGGSQNVQSSIFQTFETSELWKTLLYFCQNMCLSRFLPDGRLTKWTKFFFLSIWIFKYLKNSYFCQKRSLGIFSPRTFKNFSILEENCGACLHQ